MLIFHFTVANLKMIVRDRQTLFWALAFPLVLMLTMGLMMRGAADIAGAESRLAPETEASQEGSTDFLDFLVPGMAVWGIMSYSVFGIATSLAMYRDRQVLRRMQATPLKVRTFFIGQVLASLMVAIAQGALILSAGKLVYGVNVEGNLLYLLVIMLLGNLVFLNIGFVIGSISRTPQAASGIGNAVVLPLAFFSGAFFPTGNLPQVVKSVVGYMPLAPVVDAVRGVTIEAGTLADYSTELGLIGAWIAISAALAVRLFRFE